jgi:glycine dehydrogenase
MRALGALTCCATDLLALTLLKPPGEWGADIAFGSAQRFGVPMGFGGPHAAFFACTDNLKRKLPGRLVGVSKDETGRKALRLALQTREQHIRREKATSNICTAQALLANMAAMYAVYHGPQGLTQIASQIHGMAAALRAALQVQGHQVTNSSFFDTLTVSIAGGDVSVVLQRAEARGVNLGVLSSTQVQVAIDETTTMRDLETLVEVFAQAVTHAQYLVPPPGSSIALRMASIPGMSILHERCSQFSRTASIQGVGVIPATLTRKSSFLTHKIFNSYHSETEMLRYIRHLESKDLSLCNAMIPLGSCTMKLNATTEMMPISWPEFSNMHPFAPAHQTRGYAQLVDQLQYALAECTGFDAVSVQPNSGAQGEYAGLRVIRAFQTANGQGHRDVCLIPVSAHGTNPASAAMAGLRVVAVACDDFGNLDVADLKKKLEVHSKNVACMMITYPSTFGVFEEGIQTVCEMVHNVGGQVYLDGANLNAQLGICRPGDYGADVCHMNLHKTCAIPHGGGGPGVGPICVKGHLAPFLPGHPHFGEECSPQSIGPISAAPYGSAGILPISWAYLRLLGATGVRSATEVAILNANYLMKRLEGAYEILYTNKHGLCAHEFILDARPFGATSGVEAVDIAKRLHDYGFHSPTMSWPVANTLMIEPTESESKRELDRFADAMLQIREEIRQIENGTWPKESNPLVHAPHPIQVLLQENWDRPYSREVAAFPVPGLRERKFWPTVSRVDDLFGDKHLICTCPSVEEMADA